MTGVFICPVDDESAAFGPALEIGCALGTVLPFINDAGEAEVMKNLYPCGHCRQNDRQYCTNQHRHCVRRKSINSSSLFLADCNVTLFHFFIFRFLYLYLLVI